MTSGLIWERISASRPGRKLDYSKIASTAMAMADAGGIDNVSARNLARELDTSPMSLYRYADGKDDLWDLMLDSAFGEIILPAKHGKDWRRDVLLVALETRRVMLRHPWMVRLVTARPTLGPRYLDWFEFLMGTVASSGRNLRQRVRIVGCVWAFTSGFVGYELGERESDSQHGLDEHAKRRYATPYMEKVLATGRYPNVAEFFHQWQPGDPEQEFRIGLKALLAGFED